MSDDSLLGSYTIPSFNEEFIEPPHNEAKIRMALLKNGKITVPWIEDNLKIPRQTAQDILKRLLSENFCTSKIVAKKTKYNVTHVRLYTLKRGKNEKHKN